MPTATRSPAHLGEDLRADQRRRPGMVVRGQDASNPVLLWVHGGPGMPDYFLTQDYPTKLEDLFTIVWWDQRGAACPTPPTSRPSP